jgi:hypothetical protein
MKVMIMNSVSYKYIRAITIFAFGFVLCWCVSYLLILSVQPASATIHWKGGAATDNLFISRMRNLGMKLSFGSPVTLNGNDGYYAALLADQEIPQLLKELKEKFSDLPDESIVVGKGTNAGFFTVKADDRTCSIMLIRDYNINKTILLTVTSSSELFKHPDNFLADEQGIDPIAELRPPGSKRVFSFETHSTVLAAYKSVNRNLADFYESALSAENKHGASIMTFTQAKLPDNGNFLFFDSPSGKGFVVYQICPKDNCSYSIVCSQPQQQ